MLALNDRRARLSAVPALVLVMFSGAAASIGSPALFDGEQPGARAGAAAAATGAESLPITRITLYRSGVGYFLRTGQVQDSAQVQLKFDVSQINDVLKSLQVLDLDGGRVDSVSYASKDPLSRRLASFSLPIADNPSLPAIMERLRGSKVTLTTVEGTVSGTVLSTETRKLPSGGGGDRTPVVIDTPMVNIVTATGLKSVRISDVSSFQILDKQLAEELDRALTALAESRAERVKTVDLSLSGAGARRVALAYVHETPVWKTSYRLVLPEAPADGAKASGPQLQGWAIVENTTDQDWSNVRLSLVSGRPVSFRMDLYEPMYVFRPEVAVPTVAGVMPRSYEGGTGGAPVVTGMPAPAPASAAPGSPGGGGGGLARRMSGARDAAKAGAPAEAENLADRGFGISAGDMAGYAPAAAARAGEVGEVFQYELASPVTIERQRSAMLPIINASITGRRVSIYNQGDRADHPMRGVEITNSTSLQLLPGPISVFDGAAYAGDATINQVSAGDKRLLAYAVDLDVAVTSKPGGDSNITNLKIVEGAFIQTQKQRQTLAYTFDNKDLKRGRTIIVEAPKLDGWTLVAPTKPEEQTQTMYRFGLEVDAAKAGAIEIVQERVYSESVGLFNYDPAYILRLHKDGKLSDAVLKAFQTAAAKQGAINEQERQIAELDRQLNSAKTDTTQITQMMNQLDRQNENYATLNKRLKDRLARVETLETQRTTAGERLETLRRELAEYLRTLTVE